MSARDAWARLTPYEVGLPGRNFADSTFGLIAAEAEARGLDATDPGAFVLLGEAGRAVRAIQGDERGREAIHRYGAFLFHAYHFHRAGEVLLLLTEGAGRYLVEGSFEASSWKGSVPAPAGYLQLPAHLFWSDSGQAHDGPPATPEPIDGFFWSLSASGEALSLLVTMGVREGRPGLSLMELPPVELSSVRDILGATVREGGHDFANTMPGGELDRLYSVLTLGEALKLAGRAFAYFFESPEALGSEERGPSPEGSGSGVTGPRPSRLPFRRVLSPTSSQWTTQEPSRSETLDGESGSAVPEVPEDLV